jgi:hypothetical protein
MWQSPIQKWGTELKPCCAQEGLPSFVVRQGELLDLVSL